MKRTLALAVAALGLSCDNGKKTVPPVSGPARVTLKNKTVEVTILKTEKERRHAPEQFSSPPEGHGYLMAWPRERFMKLETGEARASFDVAFLDRSGKIVDIQPFLHGREEGIMPKEEAAYALFVGHGSLSSFGARKGDRAEFSPEVAAAAPQDLPSLKIGDVVAHAELALTDAERQHGLMFRPRLSADDGMLFAYDHERMLHFWMKNTLIPLDIAFFKENGTLVNVRETPLYADPANPGTNYKTSDSLEPARFVLEMNLGWFRKKGLVDENGKPKPGTRAEIPAEAFKGFRN